ncbi:GNAT family N-acetyltransferase [Rhizobium rhizogenes]|uniref:GNAT family N-acetyltransferase n=1 Tax=Rhizobium rhizogenes TaxID=359 RepID=UPI0022B689FC|nr:GNAT family N-acetyltransferase [Rhizobium rhizogenes]MCZ7448136.1 GNAT family N-acetyltransferase [Rhizobium rhizogenes]MCZ7465797.1 GNAT family N-acetyltransferase [Rhizobium rhizogenes]
MVEHEIRAARPTDLLGVLALDRQLNPGDPVLDLPSAEATWSALLSCGLTTVFVDEMEGKLVSSRTLAIVPNLSRGARSHGVIENVVTDADHRQMGLGRAVLHSACKKTWEANCYKVLLATGSQRESTLRFYEGAGFQRGGKTYFEIRRP